MHELSIAQQLVAVAEPAARKAGAARVNSVRLRLGRLAGVVRESLEFSYEIVTSGTLLEGSVLAIDEVGVAARCPRCQEVVEIPEVHLLRCSACGTPTPEVVRGRELEIVSLDYDPATATTASEGSNTGA